MVANINAIIWLRNYFQTQNLGILKVIRCYLSFELESNSVTLYLKVLRVKSLSLYRIDLEER